MIQTSSQNDLQLCDVDEPSTTTEGEYFEQDDNVVKNEIKSEDDIDAKIKEEPEDNNTTEKGEYFESDVVKIEIKTENVATDQGL